MRIVTLIPLSKRAKHIVKQHGERWSVVIGDEISRMVEDSRAALAKKGGAANRQDSEGEKA